MSYRLEAINKKGNYIRVETTIKNNKNYLNQQLKQHKPTTFRSNQLPRAARKTMHGVNKYINPNKKIVLLSGTIFCTDLLLVTQQ